MRYPNYNQNDQTIKFQKLCLKEQVWHSCINCMTWCKKDLKCKEYGNPPPDVIVHGCHHWELELPF